MTHSDNAGNREADHDACIADKAFGDRVRGYIDVEIGEESTFEWGLACLDRSDLFHLRQAVHRYFRHVAQESVGDAKDIAGHVRTVQQVGELAAALEVVEEAEGDANKQQNAWRSAEWNRKYHEEVTAIVAALKAVSL
jgi:hypothetical protein